MWIEQFSAHAVYDYIAYASLVAMVDCAFVMQPMPDAEWWGKPTMLNDCFEQCLVDVNDMVRLIRLLFRNKAVLFIDII